MFKKSIVRSFCAFSLGAAALALSAVPGNAWDEIIIDNETHRDNTSLVQGTYTDWTHLPNPWDTGNEWPFVYNRWGRNTSSYGGTQKRYGVAVWRVQIPKTGWYNLKASYKQTDNRTTAAQYYVYTDVTLEDIDNQNKEKLEKNQIFYMSFNQHGENSGQFNYAEFGAFCMKEGEVSVLVLDARATERSSSADAGIWTYLGDVHNSEKCEVALPPPPKTFAPTNYLLLQDKKR